MGSNLPAIPEVTPYQGVKLDPTQVWEFRVDSEDHYVQVRVEHSDDESTLALKPMGRVKQSLTKVLNNIKDNLFPPNFQLTHSENILDNWQSLVSFLVCNVT